MSNFNILTLGEFISEEGIKTSIESFSDLFHEVTSKHQRKMQMTIITKGTMDAFIIDMVKKFEIEKAVNIIPWSKQEEIENCYNNSSVMLLPNEGKISKLVEESLSFGLPVICYENEYMHDVLDPTCGMMIEKEGYQQNVVKFSDVLRILFFDPEARKILQKGATKKYEAQYSWGAA